MNLKSLYDLSHINCASCEIIVGEGFDKASIYDIKEGKEYVSNPDLPQNGAESMVPALYVMATHGLKLRVMSDFEILRRQIMSKVARKSGPTPRPHPDIK